MTSKTLVFVWVLLCVAGVASCQDPTAGVSSQGLNTNFGVTTLDDTQTKPQQAARAVIVQTAQAAAKPIFLASIGVDKSDAQKADALRQRAGYLIAEIRELVGEQDDASFDTAKKYAGELADIQDQLKALNRDAEKTRQRQQAYLDSLPVENTHYSTHKSDTTVNGVPPEIHCEDEISYTSISITKSAGFDSSGNPLKTNAYELIPHKTRVCK
jgi:hypothetical protein